MRLSSIKIAYMAKFEAFESPLPAVALIQGRNGDGKSSLIDCVKFAFGRGHNEDMIHGNAPEGEILIECDNGAAVKCRSVRERNETIRAWRAPGSKKFIVSRDQIDAIANAISYDPLAFLDKTEQEQMATLLRIMPIECSDEEIKAALGGISVDIEVRGNALDRIDALHKQIYKMRHDINVTTDTQAKHAAELKKTLPPPAPEGSDWKAEYDRLQAEGKQLAKRQADALAAIRKLFDAEKDEATREYEQTCQAATKQREERVESARSQANQAAAKIREEEAPKLAQLTADLATAEERSRAAAQAEGTRQAAALAEKAAADSRRESQTLTDALDRLSSLKENVAGRLPIPGIKFLDGRILREESGQLVPFARWNTEAKMRFCLRIAVLAHGDAGFICIDNAEHFDSEKRAALIKTASNYAEKENLQFIIASVSDQPLSVTGA